MRDPVHKPRSLLREFLDGEASGGIVLMAAAALALIVANSPLLGAYEGALHAKLGPLSLEHWINDALMALFFLLVGLEIKREMIDGQLATWPRRVLPGIAAAGGMLVAAFAPDSWLAIAAFAFAGLGIANTVPIVFSAAGNFPGLAHGAGMSVATTMGYSGILVAPSAIGFIGGKVGFSPVYVAVGLLLVVVAVLAGFARHADGAETQAIPSAAL